jgi:hypothetical protein
MQQEAHHTDAAAARLSPRTAAAMLPTTAPTDWVQERYQQLEQPQVECPAEHLHQRCCLACLHLLLLLLARCLSRCQVLLLWLWRHQQLLLLQTAGYSAILAHVVSAR